MDGKYSSVTDQVLQGAAADMRLHPLRWGQAVFNAAHDINPLFCNAITGSDLDPFHDDTKVGAFLFALEATAALGTPE